MPTLVIPALVYQQGHEVAFGAAAVTFLGVVALQAGVNVVNDLFDDESGLDADPEFEESPFPLGSRVIQRGDLTRRGMALLAVASFGLGLLCGLWLNTIHPGNVVLWIGVVGAGLGYFYTAPPLRLAYLGVGEPIIFLLFGPLAGLGAYYVQTGSLDDPAGAVLSIVLGIVIMMVLFLHHFPQHDADKRHGKKTPIVRLGPSAAGRLVPVLMTVPFLVLVAGVVVGWLPWPAVAFFGGAIPAFQASRIALAHPEDPKRMTAAFGQVMLTLLVGGLLLIIGLVVDRALI
jgi:1,4-dihydroxy-2-naphthoate octaprenyltransferase